MLRLARVIRVRGTVQGVGFRPFAYRLAHRYALAGWVLNGESGVEIHIEGPAGDVGSFERALVNEAPPAASIVSIEGRDVKLAGHVSFAIRESTAHGKPTVRIAPDIATCAACLRELFDPHDRRYRYPYINCTDCGPRYSIVLHLPYDRAATTMASWTMCAQCRAEYDDPADRRFHAEPIACPACGPAYAFESSALAADRGTEVIRGDAAVVAAAQALAAGAIVAVKGIGGFHLACDARNARAVAALRERKFRKERPFAVMVRDLAAAHALVVLDDVARELLISPARPIVLVPLRSTPSRTELAGVAPDNRELGVMLPYAPVHSLLFASGAPDVLVLTSANRSSEPIAYDDDLARIALRGIADAFLVGERAIARRVDDSIVRSECFARDDKVGVGTHTGGGPTDEHSAGPIMLRRSRGYSPQAVVRIPTSLPMLALGGDLKNAIGLVVDGSLIVSQHIGDLAQLAARDAYAQTIRDLCAMYDMDPAECLVVYDAHPDYASSALASQLSMRTLSVQHHRAHVAGVVAEREAWATDVVGIACDGTGYGDDGAIWGGECFAGSVERGFARIAHLRAAKLAGGDAAARLPVQAAAGFLYELSSLPDLEAAPFYFPRRYRFARELIERDVRTFVTTSVGRLFDVVAALCGFTRESTFEGQAAMWLEHLAASGANLDAYAFPLVGDELDHRPLLSAIVEDRVAGRAPADIARAFHRSLVNGLGALAALRPAWPLVASGGVFANRFLCNLLRERFGDRLWLSRRIPANDGGLCAGQAAIAAFHAV